MGVTLLGISLSLLNRAIVSTGEIIRPTHFHQGIIELRLDLPKAVT